MFEETGRSRSEEIDIRLIEPLSRGQREALTQYAFSHVRLSWSQWQELKVAIGLWERSWVIRGEQGQTFAQFYHQEVDERHAPAFLPALLGYQDVFREGQAHQAEIARDIMQRFQAQGWLTPAVPNGKYLLMFCLYRWSAFARGYIFQEFVLRDLAASGIPFETWDLKDARGRFAPCDLLLLGLTGDIKASVYFLEDLEKEPLDNDFYITELYDRATRTRVGLVVMTVQAWKGFNGESQAADLAESPRFFPTPVRVQWQGETLFVMGYEAWKEKIQARPKGLGEEHGAYP